MAIQLQWEQHDPNILVFDLRSDWTWEEFHAAVKIGAEMMQNAPAPGPVYVISLAPTAFPPSYSVISHFQNVVQHLPPNLALIVVVTDNFLVETINQIFFKVSPLGRRVGRLAKTVDNARQIIANHYVRRKTS